MPELIPSLDEVVKATAHEAGLSVIALQHATDHHTTMWRHIGIYVARKHNYSSLKMIAVAFGYDHHSPAYYGLCRISKDFEKYEDEVNAVKVKLGL